MKITLTEFLRGFRKAPEAADRGDSVIVKGENVMCLNAVPQARTIPS
jgi:hypothetical protein